MRLKKVGEFPLIDIISKQTNTSHPSVIKGIGDDAAVIAENRDGCLLVTTDIQLIWKNDVKKSGKDLEDVNFEITQFTVYQRSS